MVLCTRAGTVRCHLAGSSSAGVTFGTSASMCNNRMHAVSFVVRFFGPFFVFSLFVLGEVGGLQDYS